MNKIKYLIAISPLLALTPASAEELSQTGEMLDGIVAIVNEGVVLRSQLESQIAGIEQRAQQQGVRLPPRAEIEEQILEQLIIEEIQLQRADRVGIQVSDQVLNEALTRVAASLGIEFPALPEALAKDGIEYGEYRREMRKQLIIDQLRQIDVIRRISVAPREIEMCIADLEGNAVVNSDYKLSHILISVPDSATAEQFAEAETEAQSVHQRLLDGADFAALAIQHSDSQTALEGGSLDWRKGDQLPTLFADVVGPLQAGEFSQPIRAVSGFHIVKVDDIRGVTQKSEIEQVRVRHILVTPDEIIDSATAKQRVTEARDRILAGEDFGEIAKLFSDDPGSQNEGGDMGWTGPGTFVPEFEDVANTTELNTLSDAFESRFGWHILEVTGRRTYDNTEEVKQQSCIQQVRNSKLANESELWVRRIRDEAYVDKRI